MSVGTIGGSLELPRDLQNIGSEYSYNELDYCKIKED